MRLGKFPRPSFMLRKAPWDGSLSMGFALLFAIIGFAGSALADYEAGLSAYQRADYATALREWHPLAKHGHADAQYYLGLCYEFMKGVPQDFATAQQWYEKAAVQGHAGAQVNLGSLYDSGRGGPQDFKLARTWYRRSADQGNGVAQRSLGLMSERGRGVPQDVVEAQKWYILAEANGDMLATELRDALAKHMTAAQLFQAQQRVQEWKPKAPGVTTAHKQGLRKSKR